MARRNQMTCKFCGCTDRRPCMIPMFYVPAPRVPELLELMPDEYPIIARPGQVAEFTTPCHWSTPDICSAPTCIEKAYAEACALVDALLEIEMEQVA
jgi:hypothetical protein